MSIATDQPVHDAQVGKTPGKQAKAKGVHRAHLSKPVEKLGHRALVPSDPQKQPQSKCEREVHVSETDSLEAKLILALGRLIKSAKFNRRRGDWCQYRQYRRELEKLVGWYSPSPAFQSASVHAYWHRRLVGALQI